MTPEIDPSQRLSSDPLISPLATPFDPLFVFSKDQIQYGKNQEEFFFNKIKFFISSILEKLRNLICSCFCLAKQPSLLEDQTSQYQKALSIMKECLKLFQDGLYPKDQIKKVWKKKFESLPLIFRKKIIFQDVMTHAPENLSDEAKKEWAKRNYPLHYILSKQFVVELETIRDSIRGILYSPWDYVPFYIQSVISNCEKKIGQSSIHPPMGDISLSAID